ncbi:hypothetical protein CEXT_434621 [Caerostris extrusa]|uniref:Uncharacterized protein n=1 Tax=Caerostris extrusa TaxID=172846 RepID=A0AAV4XB34_CAEEX|nr:hypothetical protein CEXT_434621 [Caerostris extrusa]
MISIICPGSEFHKTALSVKWKVLDVNLTGAFIDGRRIPHNSTCAMDDGLSHNDLLGNGTTNRGGFRVVALGIEKLNSPSTHEDLCFFIA